MSTLSTLMAPVVALVPYRAEIWPIPSVELPQVQSSFVSNRVTEGGHLLSGDRDALEQIQGIADTTLVNYQRAWIWWVDFLKSRGQLDLLVLLSVSTTVNYQLSYSGAQSLLILPGNTL